MVKVCCEVMEVDVVVVNYYFFFVDIMLCDIGVVELLFSVEIVIFDEVY